MKNVIKGNLQIPSFFWWVGVVESRADAEEMGRVKVRIVGYHDSDPEKLKTKDLPWAIPLQPVTSAGFLGLGQTPALVEGSTVIGFFADGEDGQQPIIFGSFAGIHTDLDNTNFGAGTGFRDPYGRHPLPGNEQTILGDPQGSNPDYAESDINRLARGSNAETHNSLVSKRKTRIQQIPRPILQQMVSIEDNDDYPYQRTDPSDIQLEYGFTGDDPGNTYWNEPHPRFNVPYKGNLGQVTYGTGGEIGEEVTYGSNKLDSKRSQYPYNKVSESEAGHIFEIDDTPGNERLHTYHTSGTYEEIQANGDKIIKVVGDKYEITVGNDKVYVRGDADLTVEGTTRLYVLGDVIQEVEGDMYSTIKGNRITAIQGNDVLEISGDQSTIVQGNRSTRVGKDDNINVGRSRFVQVVKDLSTSVSENSNWNIAKDNMISVGENQMSFVNEGVTETIGRGGHQYCTTGSHTMVVQNDLTQEIGKDIKISSKIGGIAVVTGEKTTAPASDILIKAEGESGEDEEAGATQKITIQTEKIVEIKGEEKVDINP